MGFISNRHTGYYPEDKAEAERIATLRGQAFARIMEAMASFDAGGQHYWEASAEDAGRDFRHAFDCLRTARAKLLEASKADVKFEEKHKESPKLIKALQLGLDQYEYKPGGFLARALTYDRRIIDLIEHLATTEAAALHGVESGDIKAAYRAISVVGRDLLEVTAEHIQQTIHDSRITHETANTVVMMWEDEGRDVIEAASEHLRQGAAKLGSEIATG